MRVNPQKRPLCYHYAFAVAGNLLASCDGQIDDLANLRPGSVIAPAEGVVAVARNHTVVNGGLDKAVKRIVGCNIAKRRLARISQRPALRRYDYLGDLGAGDWMIGAEGMITIAADHALPVNRVVVGGFDKAVESVGSGHVAKMRPAGCVAAPTFGKRHDFDDLAPRDGVVGPERVIGITGDGPGAVQIAHRLKKVIVAAYVGEVSRARRRAWYSG